MQVTNVIITKNVGEDTQILGINSIDATLPDEGIVENINYTDLDAGQKATVDAFYALAVSLLPA